MEIITNSAKETRAWAKAYAKTWQSRQIIGLIGDLGAGKTTLVQGLAAGLGIKQIVNSPTFVIMKVYPVEKNATCLRRQEIRKFIHIDAYRLTKASDLEAIGVNDYLTDPTAVIVIEWADKIKALLPKNAKIITIKNQAADKRLIKY